jgi:hypothetical protein
MNFLQQWGLLALALGAVLGFLRLTEAPLPKFDVNGGTLLVVLPPDWVMLALVVGGLALIVVGTSIRVIRGERRNADEEVPKE